MHSMRMRTARFSCRLGFLGGVSAQGVSAQARGCLPPEVSTVGGVCEQNDLQTDVKTLPRRKLHLRAVIAPKQHLK